MSDEIEAELATLRAEYWDRLAMEEQRRRDCATRHLLEIAHERRAQWDAYDRWIARLPDSPEVWQARLEGFRLGLEFAGRTSGTPPSDCTPQCKWARIARAAREDAGG